MLQPGGNSENRSIPETDYCQRDGLVAVGCSVEIVIAIQAQLIVMIIDDVVENLRDKRVNNFKNTE